MNMWEGYMNWPLIENWVCQTCKTNGPLIWGIVHAQCRCDNCHTQYCMRDEHNVVRNPICMLKDEYKEPARIGWEKYHSPISEWSDNMWDAVFIKEK